MPIPPPTNAQITMQILNALTTLIALLHIYFLVLEMFLWTKPMGLRIFAQTAQQAEASRVLAANQGLYNGFLTAGLIWGVVHPLAPLGMQIKEFFLCCVFIAGVFGAATVSRRIFFVQALPALIALVVAWWIQS